MKTDGKQRRTNVLERLDINLPVRLLGFGLIYAWGICLWDVPLPASANFSALQTDPAWLLSAILTPATCFAIALAGRHRDLAKARSLHIAAPLLCTLGTAALIGCGYTGGWLHFLCTVIAGIGTGCGPAFLVVLWGCLFARVEASVTETVLPASFVATLLCALVVPNMPPAPAGLTVALLPLASGLLLALSRQALDRGQIASENVASIGRLSIGPLAVARMVLAVFVLYSLGCVVPAESPITLAATAETYATALGMLFAITLSIGITLFARHVDVTSLYRWITIPFVVGVILAPLADNDAAFLARVLMNAVFTGVEIITMLYFIRLSQRTGRSATYYVGLGAGAAYGGVLAGYLLGDGLQQSVQAAAQGAYGCLMLLGIFVLTSLLIPRRDATVDEEVLAPEERETQAERDTTTVAASYANEVDALIARRKQVAASHGLSARETEIFLLLAQGRSRPYIRDTLFLSKNTVATHIRHIYEKLGIHSHQELIDLVEE